MKKHWRQIACCFLAVAAVAASVWVGMDVLEERNRWTGSMAESELHFSLQLSELKPDGDRLIAGYNYALLKAFASHMKSEADIRCDFNRENYYDSLKAGSVDLVVLPFSDRLQDNDSISFSVPVDSVTVWAVRSDRLQAVKEINSWLTLQSESEEPAVDKRPYMRRFSPARAASSGRKLRRISPYDELVKQYADSLEWDWRLLSALIYEESHFHIEAHSGKGAQGLMQMMPRTAGRFGAENLLDPEESLRAAVLYLARLQNMFGVGLAKTEQTRFVLAAYNAGEGRFRDFVNYANSVGADSGTWIGIASIIPHFTDRSILEDDSVTLGMFDGTETLTFVENIMRTYRQFCIIHPED